MLKYYFSFIFIFLTLVGYSQESGKSWGDQGNGTYINPILNADYSDPDVIRVDDKYYMVASDFHFLGMQVLQSDDMVNWKLISQIYNRFDFPEWERNERYKGGSWAPSIRYHYGKFWVFFCTPQEGLFMSSAEKPEGPWSPLHLVKNVKRWEDPCPFWDEDGRAYLGRSVVGAGPIIIHKMKPDGTELLDDGVVVYTGPVAEGTKIYKRNGYYYLSIPEGGVAKGWQTVLRAKNIYGPYEKRIVLEQGMTNINGPHQGAMVDTPDGEWFFFHFQKTNPLGRVVHLQPMYWENDWPVVGVDLNRNGIGEPVYVWKKPVICGEICHPQTSDDFNGNKLSLQWQFNHNPVNTAWSLEKRKGMLTLSALYSETIKNARNTITQKTVGYLGEAYVKMNIDKISHGQKCGVLLMGKYNSLFGVSKNNNSVNIYFEYDGEIHIGECVKGNIIYIKVVMDAVNNKYHFEYSYDDKNYISFGNEFSMEWGNWKGARIGFYCYNTLTDSGEVSYDYFEYYYN